MRNAMGETTWAGYYRWAPSRQVWLESRINEYDFRKRHTSEGLINNRNNKFHLQRQSGISNNTLISETALTFVNIGDVHLYYRNDHTKRRRD